MKIIIKGSKYLYVPQFLLNNLILYIFILKVHRVIQFSQSAWLAEYIVLNTKMRKKATNDFEKDFFKLMINSIFGQ